MTDPESARRLFRNARREALFVVVVFLLALAWTVGYCYLFGYQHDPDDWVVKAGLAAPRSASDLRLVLGLPDWVAYGILAPWAACTAITVAFCLLWMKDDELGSEAGEGASHGH